MRYLLVLVFVLVCLYMLAAIVWAWGDLLGAWDHDHRGKPVWGLSL